MNRPVEHRQNHCEHAFQFLGMISPLSWMPIAILAFATWEGANVFLIAAAAIWPILFSTAADVRHIDPAWFKVARNLGANSVHLLTAVIVPAVSQDILTGIRLALGVGWIVLVPAEYLGVKFGLGYAINDAREVMIQTAKECQGNGSKSMRSGAEILLPSPLLNSPVCNRSTTSTG
jgi:ABC-type nitrate/sulfonate/bicarbonate transport system permease component